jgi:hypothetical protein
MMSDQKYICIDLDGTIAHYKEWQGEEVFGDPVEGVQAALNQLRQDRWKIIIHTTRSNEKLIEGYLNGHSIPFDYINHNPDQPKNAIGGKPYADAYVDDRGIQFNGNWSVTLNEILHFAPWEMRTKSNQGDEYRKEAISFLGRDYGEAFSQFREYDKQLWEITRFSFLQLMGSIGAVWAVFSLANDENAPSILTEQWRLVGSIILIVSFLFSTLAVRYILRIRVYFAGTARYINDHRDFFLSTMPLGFRNRTGFFTKYQYPKAFDKDSTQLLSTYFISVVSSFILGFGIGLLANYLKLPEKNAVVLGIVVWLVSGTLEIAYAVHHLKSKTDESTQDDVFGLA